MTEIDLERMAGIAELYNEGLSPDSNHLLILGRALLPTKLAHEAWLVDLSNKPPTAKKLFSDDTMDYVFAWSPDGKTLLMHTKGKPRYWRVSDAAEIAAPRTPAQESSKVITLVAAFSEADKLLQQSGFKAGRGWVADFSSYGAACNNARPVPTITIAFQGLSPEVLPADAWWLRFAPEARALFWAEKDKAGTLYGVVPNDLAQAVAAKTWHANEDRVSAMARFDKLFAIGKHGAEVRSAAVNADGSRVFTAGMDGMVRCWNVTKKKIIAEVNGIAGLPVQVSELRGMQLSEGATHLIVYAEPLDQKHGLKPGRMWVKKLEWPAAIAERATE